MFEFLRRTGQFVARMDRATWTSLLVSVFLLVFVIVMFLFGPQWREQWQDGADGENNAIVGLMNAARSQPLALALVMLIFGLLALTGFPQVLLITACVLTFGPVIGGIYSWIATMASASFTFLLGHLMGARWVSRFSGDTMNSMMRFLSKRGILTSAVIRVVPSAPFIVINSVAGAAHLPFWKFSLGTAIGIIPKIMLVSVLGAVAPDGSKVSGGITGLLDFVTSRSPVDLFLIALIVPLWLVFLWLMRRVYQKLKTQSD